MVSHDLELQLYYDADWNYAPVLTRNGCRIMRGVKTRGDSDPANASLTIDNESEDYSPRSLASALRGKIGQNTPARILVDSDVRIVGEAVSWKPARPIQGSGWTDLQIAGVLQRIGRGRDPLASPAQRSIIPLNPSAYYPLTDGNKAGSAADLIGGTALALQGAPDMGKVPGPGAGDTSHPELVDSSGYIGGLLGNVPPATSGEWTVEFWFRAVAGASNARAVIAQWRTTGTYAAMTWLCYVQKSAGVHSVTVVAQHDTGTATGFQEVGGPFLDGEWHQVRVTARQDTATQIHVDFYIDDVLGDSTTASPWTVGNLTQVEFGDYGQFLGVLYPFLDVESLSVAHAARWTIDDPDSTYEAGGGYRGELATYRFVRISAEEGIPTVVVGDMDESVAMGPQRSIPLLDQYDEIALTDDASIFETRSATALSMRTGASKLNQEPALILEYRGDIYPNLVPVYGDEGIRNDVTASAPNGSSRRVQQTTGPHNTSLPENDPQGVGRYQTRIEVNPDNDNGLADAAGWRVHQGTFDGTWYAEITVDLDASPGIASAVAALDIGDVIGLAGLPVDEALDTVYSIIIGIGEDVPPARRLVTLYCVPAAPYTVGILSETSGDTDPLLGHLDTDGTETLEAITAGASSFRAGTTEGPYWTMDSDDFPLDVMVDGQRVSVSAIGPAINDTFTRTESNGFGVEPTTGITYQVSGGSLSDYSVNGTTGLMSLGTLAVQRRAILEGGLAIDDFDISVVSTISAALTGAGGQGDFSLRVRYTDLSNYVDILIFRSTTVVTMAIRSRVAGVDTVSSFPTITGVSSSSSITMRLKCEGSTLQGWAWLTGGSPTVDPLVTLTGLTLPPPGGIEVNGVINASVTNALPVVCGWDAINTANPQVFTIQPSGYQVEYDIAAGASVTVQQPVVLTP